MSANEIATVSQQYRERIAAILEPDELARFDAYQQRLQAAITRRDTTPVALTPEEQALLERIAADMQAAALQKQLDILIRITTPPQ
jgi:hypothetical protein